MYFFTAASGTRSKADHTEGHKGRLNTYKKNKLTPHILSVHPGLKIGINNRNNRKHTKSQKLNNSQWNEI